MVHLLAPAPFGGMESVVNTLALGQIAAGQRVTVAALVPPGSGTHPFVAAIQASGVPIRALATPDRAYLGERKAVRALLEELAPDVLHTHGYRPDVVDSGIARSMGVFTASTVHGFTGMGLRGRVYEWLQARWFRRFDAVVAVSEPLRAQLAASGVPPSRLHLVRNAWSATAPPYSRSEARDALGIPPDDLVAGWVGRVSVEKGPDVMVEALAAYPGRDLHLSFIGTGPMEAEVRDLARSLGVTDRIRWHGMIPEAGRYLTAFDTVLLTSRTEGTPIVLLEAMAAGVPIVTTAVGGIPQVVSQNEALLVPSEDPPGIARALDDALAQGDAAVQRSEAARARLARDFAVENWVVQYHTIYRSYT